MQRSLYIGRRIRTAVACLLLALLSFAPSGCFIDDSYEAYYGRIVVPRAQDFRWIDGGLPQTFDPAFAAAPPDTDVVRAIFEGLTDYDPRTLTPVPAVAMRWESSNEGRTWTFYLRANARWSNGEAVTANDFVNSWQRTMKIGELAPHTDLLNNIVGANTFSASGAELPATKGKSLRQNQEASNKSSSQRSFGAEAIGAGVLRVHLQAPDLSFPALVAHPVFRPVKLKQEESQNRIGPASLVSNGAFFLAKSDTDRIVLERADNYWGRDEVSLQHVEFVGAKDAEAALAAYRAGEVDAVTNAAFEPLALKLLAPYKDFRRETYGALTYYNFNMSHRPFDDVRVREALVISIDRERLSQDEMGGATEPAKRFLPEVMSGLKKPVVTKTELIEKDDERARELLAEAGYPEGGGFPKVRLLINRNEQQRIVAQSIASMWRSVLNIETEVIIKNWAEYEAAIRLGDYDIVRRGMVMQTTDELTNIRMLFQQGQQSFESVGPGQGAAAFSNDSTSQTPQRTSQKATLMPHAIESEAEALNELRAIPLYFASSYALVKPYVAGFHSNLLDAPSLRLVRIDTNWSEPRTASLSGRED